MKQESPGKKAVKEIVRVPVITDALEKARVPLSAAVKANGFVFVSGLPPLDKRTGECEISDIRTQARLVLEHVKNTLEAAGSCLPNVVKCNVYISNSAYFNAVNEVYRTFFPEQPPARTFISVGSWPWEFDIEIECIAVEGRN